MSRAIGYSLGHLSKKGEDFVLPIPKNTDDLIENSLIVDQMGGGKTNLLMSLVYGYHSQYVQTNGERGVLPVVFVPKFEWYKMGLASEHDNIAPGLLPESVETSQVTFPVCEKPDVVKMPEYSIPFSDLTIEDIGSFSGMRSNKDLGEIQGLLESLGKDPSIHQFLDAMWTRNRDGERQLISKYSALYYTFSKLERTGLFNTQNYPVFSWKELVMKKQPIVLNFGRVQNSVFQGLGGYLLRELESLGDYKYNHVVLKKNTIDEARQRGEKPPFQLTEEENFFLKWFNIGLFIDEAPKLFTNTTSSTLAGFPATKSFKTISGNDGRKMGFKYTVLITQFYKDVYFSFRKRPTRVYFGNKISKEDFDFIAEEKILHPNDMHALLSNKKFCFTMVDMPRYRKYWRHPARRMACYKFKAYRSPCGVF